MRHYVYLWALLLLGISCNMHAANRADSIDIYTSVSLNTNPFTGRTYFGTIKVNTLQVLFSEVPFSLELFLRNDLSIQLQAGIIFPLESDSFLEQFFRSTGTNSTASEKGLISYRKSPYNNHGMSYKAELRMYRDEFYLAPQLMYKVCGYDDAVFHVFRGSGVVEQTESKSTRVLGLGMMAGRQTYFMKQVTDWYMGFGLRARQIESAVHNIRNPKEPASEFYPDDTSHSFRVYPFINVGFRIGLVL